MLKRIVQKVGGDPNKKALEVYSEFVESINSLETEYEALSNEQLTG
jgi:preprotein translocase subunit SecA